MRRQHNAHTAAVACGRPEAQCPRPLREGVLMRAAARRPSRSLPLAAALLACGAVLPAKAGVVPQCGEPICSSSFSIFVEGMEMGGGQLNYDAETGNVTLDFDA